MFTNKIPTKVITKLVLKAKSKALSELMLNTQSGNEAVYILPNKDLTDF